MKKLIPVLMMLVISCPVLAQYKKAGFFQKQGRTYEAGAQLYALGDGRGTPIGYKIGFGRDSDGKRFFSSWELQFIPSYAYSYSTTDYNQVPVQVSGKSKNTFIYAVHYNFHLLKNEGDRPLRPFLTAGLNFALSGGPKTEVRNPETWDYLYKEVNYEEGFNMGIGGGAGTLIRLTSMLDLKLQGGYNFQAPIVSEGGGIDSKPYYLYKSHPYVSLSFRVRIVSQ